MKPNTINILYWVFTLLFAGLMIFSAIPNIMLDEATMEIFVKGLGYPAYSISGIK